GALRRVAQGKPFSRPSNAPQHVSVVFDELEELRESLESRSTGDADELTGWAEQLDQGLRGLKAAVSEQEGAATEVRRAIEQTQKSLTSLSQHMETLAISADESSSSILEMSATNDEVAEN